MLSFDIIEHFHIKLSRNGISIVLTDQTDLIASCLILPNDRCSKKFLHITCLIEQVVIWHLNGLDYQMTNFYDRWEKPVYAIFLCSVIKLYKQAII